MPITIDITFIFWPLLAIITILGTFAFVSPFRFRAFAERSSHWVDTEKVFDKLNQRVDVDRHVLRHCRLFGGVVLCATGMLAYLYINYVVLH